LGSKVEHVRVVLDPALGRSVIPVVISPAVTPLATTVLAGDAAQREHADRLVSAKHAA
jgi:hypothetical protein